MACVRLCKVNGAESKKLRENGDATYKGQRNYALRDRFRGTDCGSQSETERS